MTELFFDTETSGLTLRNQPHTHPGQPWIIQLGMILADGADIHAEINLLIKPDGRTLHPRALETHGITTDRAQAYGVSEMAAVKLFGLLAVPADMLVCHNLDFDLKTVKAMFARQGYGRAVGKLDEMPHYCTMEQATDFCKLPSTFKGRGKYKWPKLEELHRILFNEDFEGAHDALADVRATMRCFYALQEVL